MRNVLDFILTNTKDINKLNLSDLSKVQKITNHPVHILDKDGHKSPSAFIPFCQFGSDMTAMGTDAKMFRIPVCNSFQPKIFYDQLCYQVDIKTLYMGTNMSAQSLRLGLSFLVDTNFNRQYSLHQQNQNKPIHKEDIGNILVILVVVSNFEINLFFSQLKNLSTLMTMVI